MRGILRKFCRERGVERIEGKIVDVALHGENGYITSVTLASGAQVEGELFSTARASAAC